MSFHAFRSGLRRCRLQLVAIVIACLAPLALQAQTLTIVSGNGQTLTPKQPSQPLVVQARDAQGAPLAQATISWSSANATASFAASTTTDTAGQSSNRPAAVFTARRKSRCGAPIVLHRPVVT